ncbi:hypothetical protein C8F01DRAFT_1135262 [Mycena amicta]|nr:hypothetical protein C8F01DRAFT_1135262 [Mycena amicta]
MKPIPALLRHENLEKLPLSMRLVAKKALKPERTTCQVAEVGLKMRGCTHSQILCFLPVFHAILSPANLPAAEALTTPDWIDAIPQALDALNTMGFLIDNVLPDPSQHLDLYAALWEHVWPWMHFIYIHYDYRTEFWKISNKVRVFTNFIAFTRLYTLNNNTHELLLSTHGFRTVVAGVWSMLDASEMDSAEVGGERRVEDLTGLILSHILPAAHHGDSDAIQEIIDGVGGTVRHLAQVVTSHMEILAKFTSVHPFQLYSLLLFLKNVDRPWDQRLEYSPGSLTLPALRIGLLDHMVDAMHKVTLAAADPDAHLNAELKQCDVVNVLVESLAFVLSVFLFAPNSYLACKKTLGARLFRNLTLCAVFMDKDETQETIDQILRAFMPAVLLDVHALDHLADELTAYKKILAENSGWQPSDTWIEFVTVAEERLALISGFDLSAVSKACDNIQCGLIARKNQFKRCSECQDAYYCSEGCQLADWKRGDHRKVCHKRQSLGLARHGLRQRCYVRALIQQDYKRHKSFIYRAYFDLVLANPELDMGRFCTRFDYSNFRANVTVEPSGLDDIRENAADEWTVFACDDAISRARMSERFQIHVLIPPLTLQLNHDTGRGWAQTVLVPLRSSGSTMQAMISEMTKRTRVASDELEIFGLKTLLMERIVEENIDTNVREVHQ